MFDSPWFEILAPFYRAGFWLIGLVLALGVVPIAWDLLKRWLRRRR